MATLNPESTFPSAAQASQKAFICSLWPLTPILTDPGRGPPHPVTSAILWGPGLPSVEGKAILPQCQLRLEAPLP